MAMFPHERSLVKHLAGKPFALIGVNGDKDLSTPQALARSGKVTWRSFQNGRVGPITNEWVLEGWPTIVLIDKDGIIRYRGHGTDLDKNLKILIEEMGQSFPETEIHATTEEEKKRTFDQPDGTSEEDSEEGSG